MDVAVQAERLQALRGELEKRGFHGFLVPRADAHQGEYVPPHAERLAWLTGFTGSAGMAVVLRDRAALFVDGRYTLQAETETGSTHYDLCHLTDRPPQAWLGDTVRAGMRIGFDPWLHTPDGIARLRRAVERAGGTLEPTDGSPLDAVWHDQPPPPTAPAVAHAVTYAGETSADKRARIAAELKKEGLDAAVLSAPESLAWLLNVRGGDVPFTPLPLGFALLHADASVDLYMLPGKLGPEVRTHLGAAVRVAPPDAFGPALDALKDKNVRVDRATCAVWIAQRLGAAGAKADVGADPCAEPRACKNATELEGTRAAHLRDGAALTSFLCWLAGEAPQGGLTELAASDRLEVFRRRGDLFRDLSFPTISGAGDHGAVVHYRVTPETDRPLNMGELYLVDSGAQYLDGTTDVTRTVAIGAPTEEMRRRYTQVLKGHIALATIRFPEGTTGSQLDALARQFLWAGGVDYDHGTGHGVGSYLGVHEGPQRVSKAGNTVALKPGMIISNEPGYYKAGEFGIRIENLQVVQPCDPQPDGAERRMLEFETLTLAPLDRRLIAVDLLTSAERAWIDGYHARVHDALASRLDAGTRAWLAAETAPLP